MQIPRQCQKLKPKISELYIYLECELESKKWSQRSVSSIYSSGVRTRVEKVKPKISELHIFIWSENSSPKSETKDQWAPYISGVRTWVQKVKPMMKLLDVSSSPFLLFLSARSARRVQKFRILTSISRIILWFCELIYLISDTVRYGVRKTPWN